MVHRWKHCLNLQDRKIMIRRLLESLGNIKYIKSSTLTHKDKAAITQIRKDRISP